LFFTITVGGLAAAHLALIAQVRKQVSNRQTLAHILRIKLATARV
jgi:hypothetical protein